MHRRTASLPASLRHPSFRHLWIALTASRFGDELTMLALVWIMLKLTGSGAAVGLVLLCFQAPTLVTSPLVGRLLDQYQPRLVMSIDNFCRALIIAAIPALHWLNALEVWHIYVLALLAGSFSPATEVGVPVIVPRLVANEELEGANALLAMAWEIATLAGPAIAGFLVDFLGGPAVLLIDVTTFLFMTVVTCSIPAARSERTYESAPERWSLLGFGTLMRMKAVRLLTALTLLLLFVQGLQSVALAVYSQRTLAAGASEYGLLMSAFGGGSVLGLLAINRLLAQHEHPGIMLAVIFVLFGLLVFPLTFLRSLRAAMLFLALAGVFAAPYFVIVRSLMQRLVPARLRGEIFGAQGALSISGYPLGGALGGALLDYLSAPVVIGLSCVGCMTAGLVGLLSPTLRGIKQNSGTPQWSEQG